jgi:inhibitor of KinA sporulation pathway (predicted exonuclease)
MAKAKIEFDLNDVDDRMAHLRAVKSLDMAMALWDITHNTKKGLEWSLENKDVDKYEVLEMVFEKIYEILDEHNVRTNELIV